MDTSFKPLPNAGPKPGRFIFLLPAAVVISAVVSIVLLVIHLRRRKGAVFSNTLAWKTITVTTVLIAAGVAVQQARVSRRRQAEKISEQRSYVRRAIIQKTQEKLWTLGYYPAYSKTTVADDLSKVWYEAGPVTKQIDFLPSRLDRSITSAIRFDVDCKFFATASEREISSTLNRPGFTGE